MTSPCSGSGVGVAKPGFAAIQFITPAAIGGALAGLSGWSGLFVGASIGAFSYDLGTFCPGGPNAMPTFTVTEIQDFLLGPTNGNYYAVLPKFLDFLGNVFWPIMCDCTSGATTVPAPTAYPSGAPVTTIITPVVKPCLEIDVPVQLQPQQTAVPNYFLSGHVSTTPDDIPLPAGTTVVQGTFSVQSAGGVHDNVLWSMVPRAADHSSLGGLLGGQVGTAGAPGGPWPTTQTQTANLTAGGTFIRGIATPSNAATTDTFSATFKAFCGSNPGQVVVPNCSPDPQTQAMLLQILQMVTLIQRQAVPFAYISGTSHAGLHDQGSLSVADLIGCKVEITTDPSSLGVSGLSPTELFNRGYITFATVDGAIHSKRLEHNPQLIFPCDAGAFTIIYYDLHPGVVVTITELEREP